MLGFVAVLLPMSVLLHILPSLTRPDVFFAVTVPPGFRATPDARRLLTRYRAILWSSTALAIGLALAADIEMAALLCQAGGLLWAIASAHRETLAFAAAPPALREVDLSAPAEHLPGGPVVPAIPLLFLAGLGLWAHAHWTTLPQRIPVHWGIHGADRWVDRAPAAVYGFLTVHAGVCLMLVAIACGLLHWSRRISTSGPAAAAERSFRRRIVLMLILSEYLLAFPAWMALFHPAAGAMQLWGVALTSLILVFAALLFRSGQGGSRDVPSAAAASGDYTPDSCWKWGLLYINPADPAILVEKRFGIGYTLNLGNRWSWVGMALLFWPVAVGLVFVR